MKIAVLLSGGVDSSVALFRLKEQGHDLAAFYIKIWLEDEFSFLGSCPWEEDLAYARAVCEQAGVPLKVVSLQSEYHDEVVRHAVGELRAGRTPSPDVLCNERIKFGVFLRALNESFERVASGHYAQVEESGGIARLRRAPDPVKDQTYFLCMLRQEQVRRLVFPVGGMLKREVRRLAAQYALPNQARKDSQGICFLGRIKYDAFVKAHLGVRRGDIVEAGTGRKLGTHDGYWFHTIGQRRGLRLGGGPWFVVGKDIERNEVLVARGEGVDASARRSYRVGRLNWIAEPPARENLLVKVRHSPEILDCRLVVKGAEADVELGVPERGIAAGQYSAFYDGDICLGGGMVLE